MLFQIFAGEILSFRSSFQTPVDSAFHISINEQPEEPVMQEHLGLINTYRRLYYYSHGTIHMDIYNQNGAVVELTQELPGSGADTDTE